jgi:hypothetical protein
MLYIFPVYRIFSVGGGAKTEKLAGKEKERVLCPCQVDKLFVAHE